MPFSWKCAARALAAARCAGDFPGEDPQLWRRMLVPGRLEMELSRDPNGLDLQNADCGFWHDWIGIDSASGVLR